MSPETVRLLEWWGGSARCKKMIEEYHEMHAGLLARLTEEQKQFYKKVKICSDRGDEVTQVGTRAYGRLIKSNRCEKSWISTLLMSKSENGSWQITGLFNHNSGVNLHVFRDYLNPWSPAIHTAWVTRPSTT
jgi:hypothetical protein